MPEANYNIGESFAVQFAWKLPDNDYIRAVFEAEVLDWVAPAEKYIVRLNKLIAGRQENADGQLLDTDAFSKSYWALVGKLVGRKITVAYEVDDSRAVHMRLETLTGEHNYFYRYGMAEDTARKLIEKWEALPRTTKPEGF
ncbi:MAG: hypothetical protein H6662_14220 [Ardenticatenaceae bacterium]|nr:hypothetical protein [Anaerolineales bacterium]MCB8922739.1 hypothetical protein [Ardenticatenaceae bacterium]MCB9003556.1 hypothetical protein [Ardenticatenaceae bacterium]